MSPLRERRRLLVMAAPLAIVLAASALAVAGDLGPQQRISITGPDGDTSFESRNQALAYNPDRNEYLAVWQGEIEANGDVEIFGKLLEPGGTPIGGQFRLSSMGPDGSTMYAAQNPTATYNPTAREYLVAWAGTDNTAPLVANELEIFAQRLSATGAEVGTDDHRISSMGPDGDTNYPAFVPAATFNPTANEYLIAWFGDDSAAGAPDELEIFAQRLSATGAEVGTDDQRISSMGPDGNLAYDAWLPAVVANPTANEYLIAWYADDNTAPLVDEEFEVYAQRLSATGAEQGTDDQRISSMGSDGNPASDGYTPTAAYNPTANEYLIAWYGDDGTAPLVDEEYEIFAQHLSPTGAEQGTDDQRISSMGPDGDTGFFPSSPRAVYNATADEYLVAWQGNVGPLAPAGELEAYAQRLAASGTGQGTEEQRISVMGPDGDGDYDGFQPTAAFNPTANEYLIAWYGDDNTAPLVDDENEVFARALTAPDPPTDPTPTPTDTRLDGGEVTLAKKITIKGKELKIKLEAGCAESCTSTATGSVLDKPVKKREAKSKKFALATATATSAAGQRATLKLKLKGSKGKRRKLTRKIVAAIRRGDKVNASVVVELTDAAGNPASLAKSARLKTTRG